MLIKNDKGVYVLSALSKYKKLVHGFSTVGLGNMKGETKEVEENKASFLGRLGLGEGAVVGAEQVHGGEIAVVDRKNSGQKVAGVDGLVTSENNLSLTIFVADCLPILAFDPNKRIVGIAHAGWQGTLVKIAENLIEALNKLGSKSADILVGLGPAIEFCHYEVKEDVTNKFIAAGFGSAILKNISGKTFLDLKQANTDQLRKVGIERRNIDVSIKACTFENPDFYSYRRDRENLSGEIAAVIGLKNSTRK